MRPYPKVKSSFCDLGSKPLVMDGEDNVTKD